MQSFTPSVHTESTHTHILVTTCTHTLIQPSPQYIKNMERELEKLSKVLRKHLSPTYIHCLLSVLPTTISVIVHLTLAYLEYFRQHLHLYYCSNFSCMISRKMLTR